jgi:Putative transposase of IS4/5 family (DUF4096)/Transposase DDE domain
VPTVPASGRADLSDAQWAVLEPLLPRGEKPGRPPAWTRRQLIDGIRWRTRTGAPWRDVPERYGPWQSVYGLFRQLAAGRDLGAHPGGLAGPGGCGRADHLGCQRGFHGRAGAPARGRGAEKGDLQAEPPGGVQQEPADHGLGRSRGGLTTKVHLACEQRQKPLSVVITAGQRGDTPQFQAVLGRIRVPRTGPGHPRTRPDRVLADKAYGPAGTAHTCAAGRSPAPSRRKPTRSATARTRAGRQDARPPSNLSCTSSATRSNAGSPGSSGTGPWPPATTSSPSDTKPPSTSPRSTNGCSPTS